MHIIILGSGVIGVTSAWYLSKLGHQVTVIDRQSEAAMETSHANAGQISPGYSAPWAAPGIPLKAIKWMFSQHAPLVINALPEWNKLQFMARMLANCNVSSYHKNKDRMLRLAEYSRESLNLFKHEHQIEFDHKELGTLQLFRTQAQLRAAQKDITLLEQNNIPYQLLDAQGCVAAEPGLQDVAHKLVGGLRLPLDQTGDCFSLVTQLVEHCRANGVKFLFNTDIKRINKIGKRVESIDTQRGTLTADQFVMALGSYSTTLLKSIGIDIPVYPVKGYSLTLPVINQQSAPISTIMDETYKVALTRLGGRIRVAGMAELNGFNLELNPKRHQTLRHVVEDLFPRGVSSNADDQFWTGLRPMTPDGTPIVGATDIDNLFLNTGHGTLGWTMSFGSARLLADLIHSGRGDIAHEDLSIVRYAKQHQTPVAQHP